jgi:triosephosphate isomerase
MNYVLGNWKMNTSLDGAQHLFAALPSGMPGVQIGVAAPFPWIVPLAQGKTSNGAWLGAQDVSPDMSGAFTGDVSIEMLAPWCDFMLIGHSERRQYHPEPPTAMRQKVHIVTGANRIAVLCVGENLTERQAGEAESVVHKQLAESLGDAPDTLPGRLLIAYEPVWAIGTGMAATLDDAESMAAAISGWVNNHLAAAGDIPVLYGGSVTPDNAAEIMAQEHVSGVLVGGASLDADKFRAICTAGTR